MARRHAVDHDDPYGLSVQSARDFAYSPDGKRLVTLRVTGNLSEARGWPAGHSLTARQALFGMNWKLKRLEEGVEAAAPGELETIRFLHAELRQCLGETE